MDQPWHQLDNLSYPSNQRPVTRTQLNDKTGGFGEREETRKSIEIAVILISFFFSKIETKD